MPEGKGLGQAGWYSVEAHWGMGGGDSSLGSLEAADEALTRRFGGRLRTLRTIPGRGEASPRTKKPVGCLRDP